MVGLKFLETSRDRSLRSVKCKATLLSPCSCPPSSTEKMGRLTLCTASIVCVENNLLLSLVSSRCHLPRDLIKRVCHSVGIREF